MKASRLFRLVAASTLAVSSIASGQAAKVSESLQSFRTYGFHDPNPIPRMGTIYPYFRFEGYSTAWKEQSWKVVTLEKESTNKGRSIVTSSNHPWLYRTIIAGKSNRVRMSR